ncbi:MAG: hypothetical protein GC137_05635 [Alphaproteobacteria bacterium]|nr:hypothetical protein [Alphaproteobacteria bacterium]
MWKLLAGLGKFAWNNKFVTLAGGTAAIAYRKQIGEGIVDGAKSVVSDPIGTIDSVRDGVTNAVSGTVDFIDGARSTVEGGVDLVRNPAGALTQTFTGVGAGASTGTQGAENGNGMGVSGWAIAVIGAIMALKNFTGGEGFSISNLLTMGATVFGSQYGGKLDSLIGGLANKTGLSGMFNDVGGMFGLGKPQAAAVTTGNLNLPNGLRLVDPRGTIPTGPSGPALVPE